MLVRRACVLCAAALAGWGAPPAAVAGGCAAPGRSLAGDVDHDGARDRVAIAGARVRRGRCRFGLVVRSSRRTYRVRVHRYPGNDEGVRPALGGLVRIARDRSLQIVVNVHHGASTVFADLYGVHDGALRRLPFAGVYSGGFSYAGSLAYSSSIDCPEEPASGVVVTTGQRHADGGRWSVVRETFRLRGGRFERVLWESRVLRARLDLPYFPFPSCRATTVYR